MKIPRYNNEKAIAVAAYLISLQDNKTDKYWFAKVMYYIERESLIRNGQPIFFDDLYSIPYGPIASSINDNMETCSYPAQTIWNEYFSLSNNTLTLLKDADYSIISTFEKEIIENSFQKFKGWGFNTLHDFFSSLPEYKKTIGRIEITYDEILSGEGFNTETIKETLDEMSYAAYLEDALHCA